MYKIFVKTLNNSYLTFTVDTYTIEEGDFVAFTDKKTGEKKLFHSSNCEIKEIPAEGFNDPN